MPLSNRWEGALTETSQKTCQMLHTWSFRVKGGTGRVFFTTELLPSSRILSCYLLFDINV